MESDNSGTSNSSGSNNLTTKKTKEEVNFNSQISI